MATGVCVVLVTCPNARVARRLAAAVVRQRVAACVNILTGVESLFWWKGKVDRANEVLLMIKTPSRLVPRLRHAVLKLHPYEVPEVIALPVTAGHPPYLRWVIDSARRG